MALNAIPPEVQSIICDHLFADTSDDALEILTRRVPAHVEIRTVCHELYEASKFSYKTAEEKAAMQRQNILNDMKSRYDSIAPRVPVVTTHNLCLLAASLNNNFCQHACAKQGCYMCKDPAHRRCFECGRNLAVALWCKMPKEARNPDDQNERPVPKLTDFKAKSSGNTITTPTGSLIAGLQGWKPAGDQFGRMPWAFQWWSSHYLIQTAIDLRCNIRRFAVKRYRAGTSRDDLDEFSIADMEAGDRRMTKYEGIRKHFGPIPWRAEYERRGRIEAEENGLAGRE
ncbi:uncharacterized protein MYCFIDRAFT_75981 [Pseudocercospora fijiensis CIRAD86]|uniref:Uncharacterized protein n=1 Tax=Pseudocercospora fijiensis (strain CIRAD86) TaxID=383855 RepID=N1QAU8_PSEFD|nr:uncharacterized protein MYCFIDRAFT_75981 [Pseudocercospora fijiensis CIRAD86]EME88147.1 hypothetical protein MYCFIDRAFT_75981 [Pseudocercospora fijiensis CIRAD86]